MFVRRANDVVTLARPALQAHLALALMREVDRNTAVCTYEVAMFTRSEEAARAAREGIDETISKHGVSYMLAQMQGH